MSHKKSILQFLFYSSFAIFLLINYNVTISSIEKSADRCVQSLLPSIFPFLILSKQVSQFIKISDSQFFKKLFNLFCPNTEILGITFVSLLVGYPVPAIILNEKYHSGNISYQDAERAVYIINGASPSFYTFFVGNVFFNSTKLGFALYACQVITVFIFIKISNFSYLPTDNYTECQIDLSSSIKNAAIAFITICSTTIFFGLLSDSLLYVLNHIKFITTLSHLLCSIIEVTNGVFLISDFSCRIYIFVICLLCTSGGLSAYYQIKSVVCDIKLSLHKYFIVKIAMSTVMFTIFNIFCFFAKTLFTY